MNRALSICVGLMMISNYAYGTFGPKFFDNWLFEIKEDRKIVLKPKY